MTDRDALLAAILANPADDTPRLVYADWLEEHDGTVCKKCGGSGLNDIDHPKGPIPCAFCDTGRVSNGNRERAEFIRVQCELAKVPLPSCGCEGEQCDNPECDWHKWDELIGELRRRERELLEAHGHSWIGEDFHAVVLRADHPVISRPNGWNNEEYLFSRGFVFACIFTWDWWLAHADAIRACQPIERVKLTTSPNQFEPWEWDFDAGHWKNPRWPGIVFELPPEPAWRNYTSGWSYANQHDLLERLRRAAEATQFVPPLTTGLSNRT